MESSIAVSLETLLPSWPLDLNPLATTALALVLAATLGELARRRLDLPRICGYSLAGLITGPLLFDWVSPDEAHSLRVLIDLSLVLLLFELGVRVDLRWLRRNPVLLAASVAEAGVTFGLAWGVLTLMGYTWPLSVIVAIICIAGSPAIALRMVGELGARGQVTERMLAMTALNVAYAVILSHLALGALHQNFGSGWVATVAHPLYLLGGSFAVAFALAGAFRLTRRYLDLSQEQASVVLFALLWLTMSILQAVKLPVLLAPLLAGMLVRSSDPRPHLWPSHFGSAGALLVILIFIVTGGVLTREYVVIGGGVALALALTRVLGKAATTALLTYRSSTTPRQALALGLTLGPMSGVAFVMADDISQLYPTFGLQLMAIVVSMIAILDIVTPILIQRVLRRVGETQEH
ncbi:MAG: cation:proton antiporter [Betaproteobacteria bacterium]